MSSLYSFDQLLQSLRAGRDFEVGRPSVVEDAIQWPQRFGGHSRPPQTAETWREIQAFRNEHGPSLGSGKVRIYVSDTTCTPHQWAHLLDVVRGHRSLDAAYEPPAPFADMLAGTPGHPLPFPLRMYPDPTALSTDTPVSPAYGPAGKPSPARMVRYHATTGDIPALIHQVTDESTGQCVLCYDIVAAAQMVGVAQQVTRVSTLASFGSGTGQWDYWPKV